jgi:NADPH:quinone reductase-like Zn-dependent oxidoreductase
VAFCPLNHSAWGEYSVCDARMCEVLPKDVSFEKGCATLNAYTSVFLLEKVHELDHKCII